MNLLFLFNQQILCTDGKTSEAEKTYPKHIYKRTRLIGNDATETKIANIR